MYAWRGRIGLLKPTHRGKTFAFWYENAPVGVEIVPSFVGFRSGKKNTFTESLNRYEQLAEELADVGCTMIAVSGSPPFLLSGHEFERAWRERLEDRLGVPVVTPVEPHVEAIRALGIERVALATYYEDELNNAIVDYFAAFGINGIPLDGYRARSNGSSSKSEGLYATSMMGLDEVSSVDVYRHCRSQVIAREGDIQGIYLNGGGWDAAPALKYLELDLGLPTIWAIAAEMWYVYRKMKVTSLVPGFGSLLATNPEIIGEEG